jgi:hypothetical protein
VPFASLLPMAVGTPDAASVLVGRPYSAALGVITDAYVRYRAVIAVEAAVLVVMLAGMAAALWRWFTRTDRAERRTRRLLATYSVFVHLSSWWGT